MHAEFVAHHVCMEHHCVEQNDNGMIIRSWLHFSQQWVGELESAATSTKHDKKIVSVYGFSEILVPTFKM